ncbi:hypothetical protein FDP41_003350 [Naegleria fowleri]|uniref:Uncharacterized protein n=1 Tax=Naegleria fowleri TaxID=5763 RepID=A0A6A5BTU3_NAEFO|nr:uncharacterized protein FDP41_003350 [Naegleria fowleri]KAF0977358.1 hypothetical protein FDP41_003350 [Naegleria fowleri]
MKRGRRPKKAAESEEDDAKNHQQVKAKSSRKKTKASPEASDNDDAAIVVESASNEASTSKALNSILEEEVERICKIENIGEYEERFNHLDQQILELEAERQAVLKVLKIHPKTRVAYSTINRFEKTKEGLQNAKFHKLGADCLGLIFNFLFHHEVVEWSVIKRLTELSTNLKDAIQQYCSCILGLCKITKVNKNATPPPFKALIGVEIVVTQTCDTATDSLLKTNPNLTQLFIREDLEKNKKITFSQRIVNKIDTLVCYGSHSTASSLSFDVFTNVKKYCYISYKNIPTPPPNAKHIVYAYPICEGSYATVSHLPDSVEVLTICLPNCPKAGGNVDSKSASKAAEYLKNLIYLRYFGFNSKTKRPDLQGSYTFESHLYVMQPIPTKDVQSHYSRTQISNAKHVHSMLFTDVPADLFHRLRHEFDFDASKFDEFDLPTHYSDFVLSRISSNNKQK